LPQDVEAFLDLQLKETIRIKELCVREILKALSFPFPRFNVLAREAIMLLAAVA